MPLPPPSHPGIHWQRLPAWLELLFWLPTMAGLSLAALRPFKATMIALQFRNQASEARRGSNSND